MQPAKPPTVFGTVRTLSLPIRVLLVGTFINTLGSFLMLFLTLYLTKKGLTPYYAGFALGAWGVGRLVGVFIGGSIADRLGYRATMAGSMLLTSVFIVGLIVAANRDNPWLVVVASLMAASIGGIWRPPAQAMITELTAPERLVMVTAMWRLTFNAGMFAAPILGAFLSRYSWDLLFWVEAGSSALFGLFMLVAMPSDVRAAAKMPAKAPAPSAAAGAAAAKPGGYLKVLGDARFSLFLFALLANAVVYIQAPSVLSLHLNKLGYPTEVFGALASLNALMVITLEVPLTKVVQRIQPRKAVALGMALLGAGLSLYTVAHNNGATGIFGLVGLVVATMIWTMGEVTAAPSMMAYPGLVAPPAMRARYIAAATIANQAGYSIGPALGVWIWSGLGGTVWLLCGALSLVSVLAVLLGTRTVRKIEAQVAVDSEPAPTPQPA
jgi:MFS family permease